MTNRGVTAFEKYIISKEKIRLVRQYVSAIIACLTTFGFGSTMAWPSPALSYLMSEESYVLISKEEGDWIASLLIPGFIIGYLINPIINDKIGPKKTLLSLSLPQITSWIVIIFATNPYSIYIGRIIGGIGYGAGMSATVLYVSEIDKVNRGKFMVFLALSSNLGILTSLVTGSCFSYKCMNIFLLMVAIFFFITFIFMPNYSNFEKRNTGSQNGEKIKCLEELQEKEEEHNSIIKRTRLWKLFIFTNNRRALTISAICAVVLVFSGDPMLTNFSQRIFTYSGAAISGENSAIILSSIKIIGCLICTQVVEKFKRKVLLLATGISGSIAMGLVGVYFLLEEQNVDVSFIKWMPIIGVAIYNVMIPVGWLNLYIIYQSELFSKNVRSIGVLFCDISYMVFIFLALFKFQELIDIFGSGNLFLIFALSSALGTFFVFILTPETKGIHLEEVQELLKSQKLFFCTL